jgi:hypothetical protein
MSTNIFHCPQKLSNLILINEKLNIKQNSNKDIVFVYTTPKVGSTSIVSSLRLYGIDKLDIIHIHDENMLNVLINVKDVSVNDIILYNKYLGKNVFVINVYRSPIEKKISVYFEKISNYHFNNSDKNVNNYNIKKIIHRFNNIFPWIGLGDNYIDCYNINIPNEFDHKNKHLFIEENGIKYIILRLNNSNEWGKILTNIFGFNIGIIKDYQSSKKPIKDLYNLFIKNYKIPNNLLENIIKDKYLNYYYSKEELTKYYNEWSKKSTNSVKCYTFEEYKLYETISIENMHNDEVQLEHYFDEGCVCKACCLKRQETIYKIEKGIEVTNRIVHNNAKNEYMNKRINSIIKNLTYKYRDKYVNSMSKNITRRLRPKLYLH